MQPGWETGPSAVPGRHRPDFCRVGSLQEARTWFLNLMDRWRTMAVGELRLESAGWLPCSERTEEGRSLSTPTGSETRPAAVWKERLAASSRSRRGCEPEPRRAPAATLVAVEGRGSGRERSSGNEWPGLSASGMARQTARERGPAGHAQRDGRASAATSYNSAAPDAALNGSRARRRRRAPKRKGP